jgi:hypothetical protein
MQNIAGKDDNNLIDWFNSDDLTEQGYDFINEYSVIFKNLYDETNGDVEALKEEFDKIYSYYGTSMDKLENLINSEEINIEDIYNIDGLEEYEEVAEESLSEAFKKGTGAAKNWLVEFYKWLGNKAKEEENKISLDKFINIETYGIDGAGYSAHTDK